LPTARAVATTSFVPVLEKHPLLRSVSTEDWDFFLTVANTFVALIVLASREQDHDLRRTYVWVAAQLHAWDAQADDALMDVGKFAEAALDMHELIPPEARISAIIAATGAWVANQHP
jgi:hypothetical protein